MDEIFREVAHYLTKAGLACSDIRPTAKGNLRIQLFDGRVSLLWKSVEAGPPDRLRLLDRPVLAAAGAPYETVRSVVERLGKLLSRLDHTVVGMLDRRNREITSVTKSPKGLLGLMGNTLAAGKPVWGSWKLVSVRELKKGGRFRLRFAAGGTRVEFALLPDANDAAAAHAWHVTPLGAVVTVRDERKVEDRQYTENQLESLLAYLFATSIHPGMRWVSPPTQQRKVRARPAAKPFLSPAADLPVAAGNADAVAARCPKAWVIAERLGSGKLLPCCSRFIKADTLALCESPETHTLLGAWNSEGMRRIRRAWANGCPEETCHADCTRFHGGSAEDRWILKAPISRPAYENAVMALKEFSAGVEELKSLPQSVMVSVSNRCNSRCIMCSSHAAEQWFPDLAGTTMNRAETEEIESLFPILRVLSIIGGEPLIEPEAQRFLARFDAVRFPDGVAHIVTNGLLLTPLLLRELRRTRLALTVSVNAACAETYEFITGLPNGYEQVLKNLRALVDAAPGFAVPPSLTLSFVVMKANYQELPAFMRLARSLNADIRLLPVFGDQGSQSIFTSEELLHGVTEFFEKQVLPEMNGYPPRYRQMVEYMVQVQRARLKRRDFSPY